MASWEDGPEYAPIERPDGFSVPDAPALSVAPPRVQPAADAPVERPRFGDPSVPVIALADLVPAPDEPRDPTLPYDVVSSALTSGDSAWSAVHWRAPAGPTSPASPWGAGQQAPVGGSGAPGAAPWPYASSNPSRPPAHGP